MACLLQRACLAGPSCSSKIVSYAAFRCRRMRVECSSSSAGSGWPPSSVPSLPGVHRLAAIVQRAVAAIMQQRAAASEMLSRLADRGSSSTRQQLGSLLLCAAAVAGPVGGSSGGVWADLTSNYVFCVGFCGWFLAQFLKIFTKRYKTGVWDVGAFFDSGGMPSSHSSLCSSVSTAVAMQQGLGSPLFAVCVCFSVIVMYDAMGIRRHAGLQAQLLNVVAEAVLEGHPLSERKLKEVLGHTPRQVYAGMVLGVLVGLLFPVF